MESFLAPAIRDALGDERLAVHGARPVGGGCISHALRVATSAGDVFVKWNDACPPDLFVAEAAGLRALAAAESGLAIPRVHGAFAPRPDRPALIVMEMLEPGPESPEALGRGLAALHRATAEQFGFEIATYCGSTRQDNEWTASWVDFYRERRLRPLLDAIEGARSLPAAERRVYERVLEELPRLLPHETTPSLVHGDLWGGNVLHAARGPALIDPACAYADRELEFGMITLFGGFGERFFRGYDEVWTLPPDWRERNPLYRLYHLLNHQLLFGGHYGAEALATARRYA